MTALIFPKQFGNGVGANTSPANTGFQHVEKVLNAQYPQHRPLPQRSPVWPHNRVIAIKEKDIHKQQSRSCYSALMPFDIKNFKDLVDLERIDPDTYIGFSPYYHFGHVYGGQAVAQGLRAAYATVDPSLHAHSLHAYFIRRGNFDEPIRYEVDRIRNGRSFATRRVVAHQAAGPILNLSASFQVREDQPDIQECFPRPNIPAPQDIQPLGWGEIMEQRPILEEDTRSGLTSWIRVTAKLGEDTVLQTCALAFASDDFPIDAARLSHPHKLGTNQEEKSRFVTASLDHSIWFHRMGRSDDWALHDYRPYSLSGARGLAIGQVFDIKGVHMATIAQEALIREKSTSF